MAETKQQIEIVKWFRSTYPEYEHSVIPSMNGLSRRGAAGAKQWSQSKAMGASEGDPDMLIAACKGGCGGLFIELKAEGSDHTLSKLQEERLEYHRRRGYEAISVRGVEAAKAAIRVYMEG